MSKEDLGDNKGKHLERIDGKLVWVSDNVFPPTTKNRRFRDPSDKSLTELLGGV